MSAGPAKSPSRSLWSRVGVEPAEERSAALMLAHSAFMGFSTVLFETAASALFLGQYSATALPSVYLAAAALSAATGYAYTRLQNRLSFATLMTGTLVALMVVVGGLRGALLLTQAAGLFFFAMVFYRVLSILTDLEYWAVAGRLYDLRQAKRLFGFIGTGEVVARIVGSFSVPLLLSTLGGVPNLLVLSALALLACVLLLRRILPMIPPDETPRQTVEQKAARSSLASLVQNPYLRFVLIVAFCGILGKYLVDFAFLQQVKSRFASATEVASFFALFSGISQCASLLTRVLLSGRVLSAIGVHRGLLILPGAHVLCTTALLVAGGLALGPDPVFWLVVLNQGIYKTFKHPIDNPSLKTLYQPIPKDQRLSLAIAVDAILNPVGIALSSALMLLFTSVFQSDPVRFGWALLACFGFWLWSARAAGVEYLRALVVALRGRIEDIAFAFNDDAAVASLRKTLKDGSEEDALVALQILGDHTPEALRPMLADLAAHPSRKVRRAALERIELHQPEDIASTLRERLTSEPEVLLQAMVLRALSAVEGVSSREELLKYAHHKELALREAAILGLRRIGAREAADGIRQLAESADVLARAAAARIIRRDGQASEAPVLKALIDDEDLTVNRLAISAAGDRPELGLAPLLIERVNTPGVLGAARSALAHAGDAVLPQLTAAFTESGASNLRRGLVSALSRMKSPLALRFLSTQADVEDIAVRQEVLRALARSRYVPQNTAERQRLEDLARQEVRRAVDLLCQIHDLQGPETRLLKGALVGSHRNTRERILMLLGLTRDPKAFLAVRTHIDDAQKDRRAYAREILDVVFTREERAYFMPAIEGSLDGISPELAAGFGITHASPAERVRAIIENASRSLETWVHAAALEAAAQLKAPSLEEAIEGFLKLPVGEDFSQTGRWSLTEIRGGQAKKERAGPMLLIEKVITLKAVDMFARTPEDVIADVAALAEEVRFKAGETIFNKGEAGESLFVIVTGEVRVHDGDRVFKFLGDKSVFGELAVLDPEPRSASITATADTHLLRLDREAFLELMAANMEVVRGVLSVLCDRIREKFNEVAPSKTARIRA